MDHDHLRPDAKRLQAPAFPDDDGTAAAPVAAAGASLPAPLDRRDETPISANAITARTRPSQTTGLQTKPVAQLAIAVPIRPKRRSVWVKYAASGSSVMPLHRVSEAAPFARARVQV